MGSSRSRLDGPPLRVPYSALARITAGYVFDFSAHGPSADSTGDQKDGPSCRLQMGNG
jgi:hypothetical protein